MLSTCLLRCGLRQFSDAYRYIMREYVGYTDAISDARHDEAAPICELRKGAGERWIGEGEPLSDSHVHQVRTPLMRFGFHLE